MKIFKKSRLIIAYIGSPKRSVMTEFLAFFLGFLLLIKDGIIKISDFGFVKIFNGVSDQC